MRLLTDDEQKAEAAFRLGNLFRTHGEPDKTEQYWDMARTLQPESINLLRQKLTLTVEGSAGDSFRNLMATYIGAGKAFYRPLDFDQ